MRIWVYTVAPLFQEIGRRGVSESLIVMNSTAWSTPFPFDESITEDVREVVFHPIVALSKMLGVNVHKFIETKAVGEISSIFSPIVFI